MKTLNPHQRYLLAEFAEDYLARTMSRRDLLRRSLLATGSIALTATSLVALGCSSGDEDEDVTPVTATNAPPTATTAAAEPSPTSASSPDEPAATAAAAEPTATIAPPTDIEGGDVSFPGPASDILGYLARPAGDVSFAAILIIHENRGLLEHYKDVARRYAGEGFAAFAIDLASRLGGSDVAGQQVGQIAPEDLVADLQAGIDYLKAQKFVTPDAIGVTGFCFGGGYTFDITAVSPDIKAAVPYYGTGRRALRTGLAETQAAVLVMYGENDSRITGERPDVEAALMTTGQPYEIIVHAGAGHAFFNDTGGNYHEAAATAAWEATLAWFREHLLA